MTAPGLSGFEALKDAGAGLPAAAPIVALYQEAFAAFGTAALWSRRPSAQPTVAQALVVADALRREGDRRAWLHAARIEAACRGSMMLRDELP